jgi:predicted phosphoribosyltransferase
MYFSSRVQAGRMLANRLVPNYRYEKNCAVIALDDGGVVVGAQIAMQLHCVLTFLNSAEINLPREPVAIAGITSEGSVAYNSAYSSGELSELLEENRGFIEQEKLRRMHELNHLMSNSGTIDKRLLKNHKIILVSDGLKTAFKVDLVYEFLKPVPIQSLIFAVPLASVPVVDKMHILGNDLYCLDVLEDFRETSHYYDHNDLPDHEKIVKIVERIVVNWV